MKIIDLLNKIAMGKEVPKKVKLGNIIWNYDEKEKTYFMNNTEIELFYIEKITKKLNEKVEIIEEDKKIEKLTENQNGDFLELPDTHDIMNKINELIDEVNKLKEGKE